jgi:lipopolysaccharide transport system ATP-binding protein
MSDIVIKVEDLSKQYRLGLVGTGTLSHDLNRWWHQVRGKEDPYLKIGETNDRSTKGSSEYVWALKDLNFEVKQGEVLGIIGKNGAGKSTLLKLLSRVTSPTTGSIKAKGRIASLLEVGTGFHPELTGRDNIYLNGAILGMTKAEIRTRFDEIVAFSGTERYIDTPVKRYSSGMRVRLAFAVAAFLEPEILIVDEVLAVGDAEFQKKAIGKMQDVAKGGGRTVLFVSHNMTAVQNLCTSGVVLTNGTIGFSGSVQESISYYLNYSEKNSEANLSERKDRKGTGILKFINFEVLNIKGDKLEVAFSGQDVQFKINYNLNSTLDNVIIRIQILDSYENIVFICNNYHSDGLFTLSEDTNHLKCIIPKLPLFGGKYSINLQCVSNSVLIDEVENAALIYIEDGDYFGSGKIPKIKQGILVNHNWKLHD